MIDWEFIKYNKENPEKETEPTSEAQKLYEALKQTKLYDKERNEWNWVLDKNQELKGGFSRSSDVQLLGILVEALFDKEASRAQYETLKQSKLYDKERRQWNICSYERITETTRPSGSQLIGVLAEALFDKEAARVQYHSCSKS